MAQDLDDKKDELDFLTGARKAMRKGEKHGLRTVGLMNDIINYGFERRMK